MLKRTCSVASQCARVRFSLIQPLSHLLSESILRAKQVPSQCELLKIGKPTTAYSSHKIGRRCISYISHMFRAW